MNIKSRIGRLEREAGGQEPTIIFFRTIFEDRNGDAESQKLHALALSGKRQTGLVECRHGETEAEFKARVSSLATLEAK